MSVTDRLSESPWSGSWNSTYAVKDHDIASGGITTTPLEWNIVAHVLDNDVLFLRPRNGT